jgi:glycosyltransferase involved in cell wall biosynthesis
MQHDKLRDVLFRGTHTGQNALPSSQRQVRHWHHTVRNGILDYCLPGSARVSVEEFGQQAVVSVILPAFNAADYIGAAIRSVLDQTFSEFELIILDNASTDNTAAEANAFTDPRVSYRRNSVNLGFAGNVELGRSLARAPYIVIFNADDIWEPSYLAKTLALLQSSPKLAFVHTRITLIDENDRPFGESVSSWRPVTPGRDAFLDCFRLGFSSPTMLIRNDVLRSVAPLPIGEPWAKVADSWLFLQLCLRGDVGFVAEPLLRYRSHPSSLMAGYYADGSFFRRHLAIAIDALGWPEARDWFSASERHAVMRAVALQAITRLPMLRTAYSRKCLLQAFFDIVGHVPSVALRPQPWIRLLFGLLPRATIEALRALKRGHWVPT